MTGAMELARNEKKIGSSLQAHPHVYVTAEHKALLEGLDLPSFRSAHQPLLSSAPAPEEAFSIKDVEGVGVVIKVAEGQKCERCWQVLPEVGQHADHPDLCHRCHDAVTHQRKEAA